MSNQTVTGTVALVYKKPTDTGGTVYSLKMEDGEWYSAGFIAPACKKGDSVQFEFSTKGQYKNLVKGTLRVVGAEAPPPTASSPAPQAAAALPQAKSTGWKEDPAKDFRIMYLASQKVSTEVVLACVAAGYINIPKSSKKPLELINAMIHESSVDLLLTAGIFFEESPTLEALVKSATQDGSSTEKLEDFDDDISHI